MARVGRKDTKPELVVRHALTRLGYKYRLHRKDLPGTPDIVLPGRRLVIFVHGCFWHAHDCRAGRRPTTNTDFWEMKASSNRERDERKIVQLQQLGWQVAVVWQCQTADHTALDERIRHIVEKGGTV